jgi:outer membrane translocation and assembly module TamA
VDIPIQERFFLGGAQSVRSFTEDDLGPRTLVENAQGDLVPTDSPSGGEFYSLVNLEMRAQVFGPLEFAMFADGGNVIRFLSDAGLEDYRFALGAGIRVLTPIGPLRVDAGLNPDPREDESRYAIFFAVGYPF